MLKVTPISNIIYLTETTHDATTSVAYYTDAKDEPRGVWWCPGSWLVNDGAFAGALEVTRLAQGRHHATGRQIVAGKGESKRAATDLTFSAPKPWTALWAVSSQLDRARLEEMLMSSVRETLDEIRARGLIETRIGKGGRIREPMDGLVAALYRHSTNREGDPHLHVHAALLNVGRRKDASIRATNNESLCEVHKVMGAVFRLRLAEKLEAAGVIVSADIEHGFIIEGQPTELADVWSKRRQQIMEVVKISKIGQTAGHSKTVDLIVKQTRRKKTDLPSHDILEARWLDEALAVGWDKNQRWCQLDRPAITRAHEHESRQATSVVQQALDIIADKKSVFYRHEIEAMALSLAVGRSCAAAVRLAIEGVMNSSDIVVLNEAGLLSTTEIIAQEREIVQIARRRKSERSAAFSSAARQVVLKDDRYSAEQRDAISHALAPAGISVIEGGPGVGKTTATAALKAACEIDQRRLILTAPSWAAVNTLKAELNYDGPSMALDKLLFDVKAERLILGPADIILFDEAGMTSTQQMLALMRIADSAGAKMILQGDTNQIAAVGRGDPLALIAQATGSQRINTIRRQRVEWQRQASMNAQGGSIAKALASYATHDATVIADNEQAVHAAMAVAFLKSGGEAVAVASTNQQVANLNYVLRQAAREMRLIGSEEIVVRVIPRGQSGDRPKSIDLALAVGDRLILGGEAVIDDVTLRNASRLEVMSIDLETGKIILKTVDGQTLVTSAAALAKAGKRGKAAVMQHAYAVTIHASQGATWSRTLWYTGHEDRRSALVAMTRHRDEMQVFIDSSSVKSWKGGSLAVGNRGLAEPLNANDDRGVVEIMLAVGKKMERKTAPRNSLDLLGLTTDPNPTYVRSMGLPVLEPTAFDGRDTSSPMPSKGLELISLIKSIKLRLADRLSAVQKPVDGTLIEVPLVGLRVGQPTKTVIKASQP